MSVIPVSTHGLLTGSETQRPSSGNVDVDGTCFLGEIELANNTESGIAVDVTATHVRRNETNLVELGSKDRFTLAAEIEVESEGDLSAAVTDAYSPSATNTLQEWSGTTIAADGGTTQLPGDEECPTPADVPEGVSGALVPLAII